MKKVLLSLLAVGAMTAGANAQLLFTQYYEGPSTNKWIEIKNIGSTSIDLTLYTVSLYTNANTEAWKLGTTAAANFSLTGSLAGGGILVIGNSGNTTPSYAVGAGTTVNNNTVANFNGNDSIVLWNDSAAFSTAQIIDALSFTDAGNQGVDKSFVRTSTAQGYNLTAGSNITQFGSVWSEVALATVNSATLGTDNYVGSSTLTAVPEPSTYAMVFAGMGAMFWTLRRKRA